MSQLMAMKDFGRKVLPSYLWAFWRMYYFDFILCYKEKIVSVTFGAPILQTQFVLIVVLLLFQVTIVPLEPILPRSSPSTLTSGQMAKLIYTSRSITTSWTPIGRQIYHRTFRNQPAMQATSKCRVSSQISTSTRGGLTRTWSTIQCTCMRTRRVDLISSSRDILLKMEETTMMMTTQIPRMKERKLRSQQRREYPGARKWLHPPNTPQPQSPSQ